MQLGVARTLFGLSQLQALCNAGSKGSGESEAKHDGIDAKLCIHKRCVRVYVCIGLV